MATDLPARCPFTALRADLQAAPPLPRVGSWWPSPLPDLGAVARMLRAPDALLAEGAALADAAGAGAFRMRVGFDDWVVVTDARWTTAWARLGPEDADPFEFRLRLPSLRLPGLSPREDAEASARVSREALARRCTPEAIGAQTAALAGTARARLRAELRAGEPHPDAFGLLLRATVDLTTTALFGDVDLPVADDYRAVERALTVQDLFLPRALSPRAWAAGPARSRVARALRRLVDAPTPPPLVAELLAGARRRGLSAAQAAAEVTWTLNSVHWAAHRYPAVHAFWVGAELSARPGLLEALRAEQGAVPEVDAEGVARMHLLRGCVLESLRTHPLVALPRRLKRDVTIDGVTLRAGEVIAMSPLLSHRAALPDGFDPTRWCPGAEPVPREAFQPGGAGRWACVGMRMTVHLLTTLWAVLLREGRWTMVDPLPPYRHGPIITPPPRDLRVRLTPWEAR